MKFIAFATFVAFLGFTAAEPTAQLKEDFKEFLKLIPNAKIKGLIQSYYDGQSPEVKMAVDYLKGNDWENAVTLVSTQDTWTDFKDYILAAGLDIEIILTAIQEFITDVDSNNETAPKTISPYSCQSMRKLIGQILGVVPFTDLTYLLADKLENSADFFEFFKTISNEEAYKKVNKIRNLYEFQNAVLELYYNHIDVDQVLDHIYEFFGWEEICEVY